MLLNMPKKNDILKLILNAHIEMEINDYTNKEYASINGITDYGKHKILLPKSLKLVVEEITEFHVNFRVFEDIHNFQKGQLIILDISSINGKINFEYYRN